jgi:hypothetical protein
MKPIIGEYYKIKELAEKRAKEKSKRLGNNFVVLEAKNGFMVISERQIKEL